MSTIASSPTLQQHTQDWNAYYQSLVGFTKDMLVLPENPFAELAVGMSPDDLAVYLAVQAREHLKYLLHMLTLIPQDNPAARIAILMNGISTFQGIIETIEGSGAELSTVQEAQIGNIRNFQDVLIQYMAHVLGFAGIQEEDISAVLLPERNSSKNRAIFVPGRKSAQKTESQGLSSGTVEKTMASDKVRQNLADKLKDSAESLLAELESALSEPSRLLEGLRKARLIENRMSALELLGNSLSNGDTTLSGLREQASQRIQQALEKARPLPDLAPPSPLPAIVSAAVQNSHEPPSLFPQETLGLLA